MRKYHTIFSTLFLLCFDCSLAFSIGLLEENNCVSCISLGADALAKCRFCVKDNMQLYILSMNQAVDIPNYKPQEKVLPNH